MRSHRTLLETYRGYNVVRIKCCPVGYPQTEFIRIETEGYIYSGGLNSVKAARNVIDTYLNRLKIHL